MLFQCWASVEDDGPALKQRWVNTSCLVDETMDVISRLPPHQTRDVDIKLG